MQSNLANPQLPWGNIMEPLISSFYIELRVFLWSFFHHLTLGFPLLSKKVKKNPRNLMVLAKFLPIDQWRQLLQVVDK